MMAAPYFQRVMAHHTVPARSSHAHGPKLAIYSHIVRLSSDQIPPGPVERFIAVTRRPHDVRNHCYRTRQARVSALS